MEEVVVLLKVKRSTGIAVGPSSSSSSSGITTLLNLSAIDGLPVLRCNARTLHVFRHGPAEGAPAAAAQVIREALTKSLVPYYPLAGRITTTNEELQIACSGEGIWFVEASAADGCTLHSLDYLTRYDNVQYDMLLPPHPPLAMNLDPLVLVQVTQFGCGGFVVGLEFCHSVCDGLGAAQFLKAVGELARGLDSPTTQPVWHRDFLPIPQSMTNLASSPPPPLPPNLPSLEPATIDLNLHHIHTLKQHFLHSTGGQTCSAFEVSAATLWVQRTRAIGSEGTDNGELKLVFFANCRQLFQPPLPQGFYGNCFFPVTATSSTDALMSPQYPFDIVHAIKLIQQAKARLPQDFAKWTKRLKLDHDSGGDNGEDRVDYPFTPPLTYTTLFVSEWGRLGFNQVDYGWGPPVHVVPIQGSTIIPVGIVGSLPSSTPASEPARNGLRLMTWCVVKPHLQPFLHHMNNLVSNLTH